MSYNPEEVGQAVFSAFVGQWFLFGIQAAARNSLHYTSTPCRRQPLVGRLPVRRDRFTVWQMILPSTSGLSFKTVVNHLTAANGVNVASSSPKVELSLNMSMLASVAENSAAESEDFISEMRLHLSCDETNCSTEKSVEWLFPDEASVIVPSPQASTCDVKCSADDTRDDSTSTPRCGQLADALGRCETELICNLFTCGWYRDSDVDDNSSLNSKENEDNCCIIKSISELNVDETSAAKKGDRSSVRTDQFPFLLDMQQQLNKCCIGLRSPVHESNWLNYSNYDVFDCSLDSEHNDLLTSCPFGFTYKSNQLIDSLSPVLFKDI